MINKQTPQALPLAPSEPLGWQYEVLTQWDNDPGPVWRTDLYDYKLDAAKKYVEGGPTNCGMWRNEVPLGPIAQQATLPASEPLITVESSLRFRLEGAQQRVRDLEEENRELRGRLPSKDIAFMFGAEPQADAAACAHRIVDARNAAIASGFMCIDCGGLFAAAVPRADATPVLHHKTSDLVARFARALAEKLAAAEVKYGYTDGWLSPDWMDECRAKLLEHVEKGDPRDVAAYCAFLWHHGASTTAPKTNAKGSVGRDHYMSDAVLLRSLSRGASNISAAARAQLLAIADGMPKPMDLNIICDWPKGMEERLETAWNDLIGWKPNYKLYDLQRMLAEFGYRMEVFAPIEKEGS